ncbi:nucleotide sugar dehydrogenase [Halovivax ruber XH-70]|uniref:UDP-N-acetyl-D-mannosamine dehydrogenase n=1 Tax=Halovivax ruber (strain DSM 18193 / JCM 13892 / XH-70) TaxID=797302 RepID=L0IE25_HALRX|nr:nucleotide sugar dehydrogenase [Halovivax ruber]AGB16217.1 nucleotide sugar dehydrogenase [Halovivax ruber XH-70]
MVSGLYDDASEADRRNDSTKADRRDALTSGRLPVAVYGLGKMGLPLAAVFADTGMRVLGVDVDPDVVDCVANGDCHVEEPGLAPLVAELVETGRLDATTDGPAAAAEAAVHVIIVPTLVRDGGEPDLSTVEAVVADISTGLAPGDLVVLESTVPPRTARDVVTPTLEAETGLDRGEFGVAVCPERTASGRALRDIRGSYPKVVGGIDAESTRAALLLYADVTSNRVTPVADATTAEAVKVFEGIYRDVNIALANELATTCDDLGISVREAIETANQLPVCDIHDPGPGVGGHCIPNYPHFLMDRVETETPLTATARAVNERMPIVTVDRLEHELERTGGELRDASVAVLGLTYRAGVPELRNAPALDVIAELDRRGASVVAVDPFVDPESVDIPGLPIDDLPETSLDAVVLTTPHTAFDRIDWETIDPLVLVDARDALSLENTHHRVVTLGVGTPPDESTTAQDRSILGQVDAQ